MTDVRYVCLSDTHFGESSSLLTNLSKTGEGIDVNVTEPSPVLQRLVDCLRHIIEKNKDSSRKPTLILNGDILELALANTNEAIMAFMRFVELAMPKGNELFDKEIIFIAGNHDHHLWEMARESQYVDYMMDVPVTEKTLSKPWHTTSVFPKRLASSYLLTSLVRRYQHLKDVTIRTAYPNYGVMSEDNKKAAIFFHGHFAESLYSLMSNLSGRLFPQREEPKIVWELEEENFAWIDFFWSTMGRSGDVGEDIDLVYKKLRNEKAFKKILGNLAKSLAEDYKILTPNWDMLEELLLKVIFGRIYDHMRGLERNEPKGALSEKTADGLRDYVNGPMLAQIREERKDTVLKNMDEVSLIFGHTHKPFEEEAPDDYQGYGGRTGLYNTGGWVVDTSEPQSKHGSSVVLCDEQLNTVALRMHDETPEQSAGSVSISGLDDDCELYSHLASVVQPNSDPWRNFSLTASREISLRRQLLKKQIES